jgi:hypothetical protein
MITIYGPVMITSYGPVMITSYGPVMITSYLKMRTRQACTYNVKLRHGLATIVAVEKQ